VRRKFYAFQEATGSPIAAEALRRIAELYAIEEAIRGQPALRRRQVRLREARPLVASLKAWLEQELGCIPPGGTLAEAIRYALARWPALCRFLDDGRIELDNNAVERAIRPIAMRESLCTPSSSVCKHWKRVRVGVATRATFSGRRRFDRLQSQVFNTDLMRCAGNNLHSRKDAGFNKAPNRVVCDA
jgi:transposase